MVWANFLHFYQPPNQKKYWVDRITQECYRPLLTGLLEAPRARIVLNINAVLSEFLVHYGHNDVIDAIKQLAVNGQIEFTGSGKYHAFLPLLPKDEIIRQITLNEESNKKIFGELYAPKGFFPPEMAYSYKVAETVSELGYEWIIADEICYPKDNTGTVVNYETVYTIDGLHGFQIYFRERKASNTLASYQVTSVDQAQAFFKKFDNDHAYILSAMDAETFGHHHIGLERVLIDMYKHELIESTLISDLAKRIHKTLPIMPRDATWASEELDIRRGVPFARWHDKDNEIHTMQWQLVKLAKTIVDKEVSSGGKNAAAVQQKLAQSLHSDQFWWASARPWWSIEFIEIGAKDLLHTIDACDTVTKAQKVKAKDLYVAILEAAFDWQRSGKVDQMSQAEDEQVRERVLSHIPAMQTEQFNKMVDDYKTQLHKAIQLEEFERAAKLRDRIRELIDGRNKPVVD